MGQREANTMTCSCEIGFNSWGRECNDVSFVLNRRFESENCGWSVAVYSPAIARILSCSTGDACPSGAVPYPNP